MRILGKGDNDTLLLVATRDEVARIMGHHSYYSLEGNIRDLKTGQDIPVSQHYDAQENMRNRPALAKDVVDRLRKLADEVEKTQFLFTNQLTIEATHE